MYLIPTEVKFSLARGDSQISFKGLIPKGDLVYRQYCLLPAPKHLLKMIISSFTGATRFPYYLRNRKHVPCFYRVIQTRVEVWENEKCCGNTSCRRVFPQLFRVLLNFHECLYNSIETRSTCFLFLLENNATKKRITC